MSFYWRITGKSRRTHRHRPGQRGPLRCIAAVPGHGSHGKTTRFLRRGFRVACSWHANPPWPDTKAADEKDGVFLKIVRLWNFDIWCIWYIYMYVYIIYIIPLSYIWYARWCIYHILVALNGNQDDKRTLIPCNRPASWIKKSQTALWLCHTAQWSLRGDSASNYRYPLVN